LLLLLLLLMLLERLLDGWGGEKITMYDKDQDWFVAQVFSATHAKKTIN
jgi:hypothetical protein